MKLYDSLTKEVREFEPIDPGLVTMYSCGPTVYNFVTIGNYRTFAMADFVYRTLLFNDYKVKFIMNFTDVGHLISDADTGTDKVEEAAEKEGKTAKEISDFYIEDFLKGAEKLNFKKPTKFTRATEYIQEQIDLIKTLEEKDFTYQISDGVYFDTSKVSDYGKLSGLKPEEVKKGARIEVNPEKKNPVDFALWKFSPSDKKRWQEWNSPWGVGFPGWHLECSAMILNELGESIDIHLGGEDLKMVHHPNEIAQSESATGRKFVNYWMHGAFLQIDEGKMSKSLGNVYTMTDIENKGFDPLALRFFFMSAHYKSPLNFTWEALAGFQNSLKKIYDIVSGYKEDLGAEPFYEFINKFKEALNDDVNMPKAVSVMWDMLKSDIKEGEKIATILKMDEVLGLRIDSHIGFEIPQHILNMASARREYRKNGIWDKADMIRKEALDLGYIIEDLPSGEPKVKRKL